MKYRALAKHFLYENARARVHVTADDGEWLTAEGKAFTPGQLEKFRAAVIEELDRMKQKLIDQNIIEG